jgi:hypothetical protein
MSSKRTKQSNFWLNDGNIVLSVPSSEGDDVEVLFRIHRSLLARESRTFGDMFEASSAPTESSEIFEGHPVVKLVGDYAEDWEEVFKLHYDGW